jgi:hypothetical protein
MDLEITQFIGKNNFIILKRAVCYEDVVINNFYLSSCKLFIKHIQSQTFNTTLTKDKRIKYSNIFTLWAQQQES